MRQRAVIAKLLESATNVYDKVCQVSQSVTDCYLKVRQVSQRVTDCYYNVFHVLQSVTVINKRDLIPLFIAGFLGLNTNIKLSEMHN